MIKIIAENNSLKNHIYIMSLKYFILYIRLLNTKYKTGETGSNATCRMNRQVYIHIKGNFYIIAANRYMKENLPTEAEKN